MKKAKGEKHYMATQIASTPMLKGNEAKRVRKEMYIKSDKDSENGAKKLSIMFSKLIKK